MNAPIEVHGTVADGFEPVRDAMAANVATEGEVGAAVHVRIGGRVVADCWVGTRDLDQTQPWQRDTLVNVYSVGKGIVAALALEAVDRGLLELDRPVADYWPAFGTHGKHRATVRHLLSHQAGVPAIRDRVPPEALYDFDAMTAAVAATEPWWEPGTRHAYHTNTFGHLVGGLLREVTGLRPGALLRERIGSRFGADVHFGVPDDDLGRCAEVWWAGPPAEFDPFAIDYPDVDTRMTMLGYANPPGYASQGVVNTRAWRQSELPSTSGHASAAGVATVYQALLDGALVSEPLLREAATGQSSGFCPTLGQDVTFGLGFQPWVEHRPIGRTPGGYGHFGTGGSLGFADPVRGIAFGYVMNHVIPRWQSTRNRALVDAVYACLDRSS